MTKNVAMATFVSASNGIESRGVIGTLVFLHYFSHKMLYANEHALEKGQLSGFSLVTGLDLIIYMDKVVNTSLCAVYGESISDRAVGNLGNSGNYVIWRPFISVPQIQQ